MQIEQKNQKNNLKTLFIDAPGSTSASVQIWFRAGSALEEKSNEGIAHFLEHMFFKGTEKRPGAQIAFDVESFGGEVNAFTSFDYTCYYINSPKTEINKTVEILLDMVSNPMFKKEDILPEREVVFEEYRRSIDNYNHFAFHQLQKSCFKGGYSHPILGREETIKNFSREQLDSFRSNHYNLSNSLFVVAGDLSNKDEIENTINKFNLPQGPKSQFPEFSLHDSSKINVHQKETMMSQITLSIGAPHYDDINAPAEDLAINTLGYGETSRLHQGLVLNDSLCNASAGSTMFMQKGGVHFIKVIFPPKNLNKVVSEIVKVLKNTLITGFEGWEVEKIKNQYISSKVYEKESLESYAFSLGHGFAQTGDIHCEDHFIERMKNVTKEDVNQALSNIFKRPIHVTSQIPMSEDLEKTKKVINKLSNSLKSLNKVSNKKENTKLKTSKYDPQTKLIEIKKGIQLVYRQSKLTPTFVLHTYLKGGISTETKANNGKFHLLSGVLTKGYGRVPYEKTKKELEDMSASFSSFSGKNAYGLNMHGQSQHTEKLFDIYFKSLLNPSFNSKFIKHEKELAKRSLLSQREDPIRICFKNVNELMFNTHPYAFNVLGTEKTIPKLTKKLITDTHNKALSNSDLLITYCGDLELERVLELIRNHLSSLKPRTYKKIQPKKYTPKAKSEVSVPFDREQTQIFIGIPTKKINQIEQVYLKMLTTHLSGQSSELFVDVRDRKGLCYTAQPIHFSALEGGYWGIYMASGHDKVDKAIEAIEEIINNVKINGIGEESFNRIKKMIEGQTLIQIQTNEDYANVYSVPTFQGLGLDYFYLNKEKISSLSYKEFKEGISKVFKRKFKKVIVGRLD